jgi:hypothetical protein
MSGPEVGQQQEPFEEILRADDDDAGCSTGREVLGAYVELELAGEDPTQVFPGAGIHFEVCRTCRAEYDGLLEAVRRFGQIQLE